LFEQNGRQIATLQPNSVTHIAVDDDRLTVNYIDRKSLAHLSHVRVGEDNVEHQGFTGHGRFAAEGNPFVTLALLHDHIRKYPEHAVSRFRQPVSLIASSIRHEPD
jgi:hypothetical protein